jgi:hypothetical protein
MAAVPAAVVDSGSATPATPANARTLASPRQMGRVGLGERVGLCVGERVRDRLAVPERVRDRLAVALCELVAEPDAEPEAVSEADAELDAVSEADGVSELVAVADLVPVGEAVSVRLAVAAAVDVLVPEADGVPVLDDVAVPVEVCVNAAVPELLLVGAAVPVRLGDRARGVDDMVLLPLAVSDADTVLEGELEGVTEGVGGGVRVLDEDAVPVSDDVVALAVPDTDAVSEAVAVRVDVALTVPVLDAVTDAVDDAVRVDVTLAVPVIGAVADAVVVKAGVPVPACEREGVPVAVNEGATTWWHTHTSSTRSNDAPNSFARLCTANCRMWSMPAPVRVCDTRTQPEDAYGPLCTTSVRLMSTRVTGCPSAAAAGHDVTLTSDALL